METKKANTKAIIIAAIVLAVILAGALTAWHFMSDNTQEGTKTITVDIVFSDGDSKTYEIKTDGEYLVDALKDKGLVSDEGFDGSGILITVDGVTADGGKQEWWYFTKNGEMLSTGPTTTPIADGEKYEITLTTGW